jgi:hypothetical protein
LKGFFQPNQPNPLILLLNLQKAPMEIPGNLKKIPIVVNQRQPDDRPINVAPFVATLTLGSQPRQGLAKVRAKSEACESHFMLPKG